MASPYKKLITGLSLLEVVRAKIEVSDNQIRIGQMDPNLIYPRHKVLLVELGWEFEPCSRTTGHWIFKL